MKVKIETKSGLTEVLEDVDGVKFEKNSTAVLRVIKLPSGQVVFDWETIAPGRKFKILED